MSLRGISGEKHDIRRFGAGVAGRDRAIFPLAKLGLARAGGCSHLLGVDVPNVIKLGTQVPPLGQVALFALAFPSFSNRRGFSQAKYLRNAGFGDVEQSDALAARQPVDIWIAAGRLGEQA